MRRALVVLTLGCAALGGCDGCNRSQKTTTKRAPTSAARCTAAAQCADDNPCTTEDCVDGACVTAFVPEGTSCDNQTVCDGVATCDGKGRCAPGPAPTIDDGNACTTDACDPVHGVTHQELPVDDFDACTVDACDPHTGHITHDSIDIDDGDDCTFDSCDPERGVQHQRPSSTYTCDKSCGPGFHAASRRPNRECGGQDALQTFCVPSCGSSFHSCDSACPPGYQKRSEAAGRHCGVPEAVSVFCVKDGSG